MEKFIVTDEMRDACRKLSECTDHPLSMYKDADSGDVIVIVRNGHDPEKHLAGCLEEWVHKHNDPNHKEVDN